MKAPRLSVLAALAGAVLVLQPGVARAELLQISDMFVFGDSLSDGGNSGLRSQEFIRPEQPIVCISASALRRRALFQWPDRRRAALGPLQRRRWPATLARRRHELRDRRLNDGSRELQRDEQTACRMRCIPPTPNAARRGNWSSSRRTPPPTPSTRRPRCSWSGCSRTTSSMRHAQGHCPASSRVRPASSCRTCPSANSRRQRHRQHPDDDPDPCRGRRATFSRAEHGQPRQHAGSSRATRWPRPGQLTIGST